MLPSETGASNDDALLSDKIQIERKVFFFDLKENPRGRFLKSLKTWEDDEIRLLSRPRASISSATRCNGPSTPIRRRDR